MKENCQINRVNYANTKHHRQLIRQNIDPQLIARIEASQQPSLLYHQAFKNVYMDQLQKTMLFQQQKKLGQQTLPQAQSVSNLLPSAYDSPLKQTGILNRVYSPAFTDFDEQRSRKFDNLINKGYGQGSLLFKAQDQYQLKKNQQSQMTHRFIKQQMFLKDKKKQRQNLEYQLVADQIRSNRMRQLVAEQERDSRIRQERLKERKNIQAMMQVEKIRRERKSLFKLGGQGKHNPITNPIEYHIDNPYILQKMQRR